MNTIPVYDAQGNSLGEEGVPAAAVRVSYAADMRYVGQAYELEVPILAPLNHDAVRDAVAGFHAAHERVYGYARTQQPVEFVNFRAVHRFPLPPPVLRASGRERGMADDARIGERRAHLAGSFVATAIYERARLPLGARVSGPAIIEQADTTTVVPPRHAVVVDDAGNLRIRRSS